MDEILYSRVRLAIVAHLSQCDWTSFSDLVAITGATRGNLSAHLEKLRAAGIIEENKTIADRRLLSRYRLTRSGKAAFVEHMREVQGLFEASQLEYGNLEKESAKRKKGVVAR